MQANSEKVRCLWAESDPLLRDYHDKEWGVPQYDSRALWELLMLECFQAGLSWLIVLKKREALRSAFREFEPAKIARFKDDDIQKLLEEPRIIRSRAKIAATIKGAQIFLEMQKSGEDFATVIWEMAGGKPIQNESPMSTHPVADEISKELKRRGFKFVGPVIVYAFMQAAGIVNDHSQNCFRHSDVIRLKNGKLHRSK
jgi:DNA-3-methyladenine glycosylase I